MESIAQDDKDPQTCALSPVPLISGSDTSYRKILASKLDLRLLRLGRACQSLTGDCSLLLSLHAYARRLRRTRSPRIEIVGRCATACGTAHDFSHAGFRSTILGAILGDCGRATP